MSNPLFWILERLYAPMEYYGVKGIKLTKKGKTVAKYEFTEEELNIIDDSISKAAEIPEEEYDDSAYFHGQLDEILAELRKLVKNTTPKNPHPRDVGTTVLREGKKYATGGTVVGGDGSDTVSINLDNSYIIPNKSSFIAHQVWGEVNPRVYDNIVRGSN